MIDLNKTYLATMNKKLLFAFSILIIGYYSSHAQNFSSNGIYYNITSQNTVEVIENPSKYTGDLILPDSVDYLSKKYAVTRIGKWAFYKNYSGLNSITIPNSVTSIGEDAFYKCWGLDSITIPNSVTSIEPGAFYSCQNLTSITLSNSLTRIEGSVFSYCMKLKSLTIPNSVTSIGSYAFNWCIALDSITIPNSVTSIGSFVFKNCDNLTSVHIGDSVTSVGDNAFYYCINLTSVNIPSSLTMIDIRTFYYCGSLKSITIPSSITVIESGAFENCSGLTSINSEAITPPILGQSVFSGVNKSILCVPTGSINDYQAVSRWNVFTEINKSCLLTDSKDVPDNDVNIYPNPASSVVSIDFLNSEMTADFQLFDMNGSLILNEQLYGTNKISVEALNTGVYLYKIIQNESVTQGRLIKE